MSGEVMKRRSAAANIEPVPKKKYQCDSSYVPHELEYATAKNFDCQKQIIKSLVKCHLASIFCLVLRETKKQCGSSLLSMQRIPYRR